MPAPDDDPSAAPASPARPRPHVVKRYANRKLYDTSRSRYVTLEEVAELVKRGEDIRIVDNRTKEDLTAVTMAQILVEEERRERRNGPLPALKGLIRDKSEQLSRRLAEPAKTLRSNVEESVSKLIRTGEERAQGTRDQIQAFLDQNQIALEEIHRRLDERIRSIVGGLEILTRLRADLDQLETRLHRVERAVEPPEESPERSPEGE